MSNVKVFPDFTLSGSEAQRVGAITEKGPGSDVCLKSWNKKKTRILLSKPHSLF